MRYEVTREVVGDLWPLCQSGDASPDSQSLVAAYLAADPSFTTELEETAMDSHAMPEIHLSPDAERRLLSETQKRARLKLMVVGGSIAFGGIILLLALLGALAMFFRG